MRTIEEIKADIAYYTEQQKNANKYQRFTDTIERLEIELKTILTKDVSIDRLEELCNAEKEGNILILTEQIKLSMNAGARAIENNKRYQYGTEYIWNLHSEDSKTISYVEAAGVLRETAKME